MDRDFIGRIGIPFVLISALALPCFSLVHSRPAGGRITLRYLTYETGVEQQALVNEIVRRFERIHPKIHVDVEFNAEARKKIYIDLASGSAPDVFYAVSDDLPRMAARRVILDQAPLAKRDGIAFSGYFPQTVAGLRWNGGLFAFPIHFSTDVLFYNRRLFDAAKLPYPDDRWKWANYIAAARRLTQTGPDGRTVVFGTAMPDPSATIAANGGSQFDAKYSHSTIDGPEVAGALQELIDLRDRYHVAPSPQDLQDTSSTQLFQTGRVAMMPGRTYMVIDLNKSVKDFQYDVALMPPMKRRAVRLAVGGTCIAASTLHPEEAWEFARFYGGEKGGLQILGRQKNCVPAATRLAYSPRYFLNGPPLHVSVFVDSVRDGVILTPPIVGCAEYMTRIRDPIFDEILRGSMPIHAGLERIRRDTDRLLREG